MHKNLLNLQAITMSSCKIHTIQVHAFRYSEMCTHFTIVYDFKNICFVFQNQILLFHFMTYRDLLNLDKLDLADNTLSTVPSSAMMPIPQLRELQLSNNPITSLKNFTFIYLTALIKLGKYLNEST